MNIKYDSLESRKILRNNLAQYENKIMEHLRLVCNLSVKEWPDERLLAHTRRGLDQVVHWDMRTQHDILGFLIFRHEFGERFDEFPAVRKALSRSDLPPDNRIQVMMLSMPIGIWDVVKRRTPDGSSNQSSAGGKQ